MNGAPLIRRYDESKPWKPSRGWREVNLNRAESEQVMGRLMHGQRPDGKPHEPPKHPRGFSGARLVRVPLSPCPLCQGYGLRPEPGRMPGVMRYVVCGCGASAAS